MTQESSRRANPFRPGVVLAVLAIGASAFLLMLYALGQGWTGQQDRDGGTHAASNGLTGFAGLVQVAEGSGYSVELSRNRGRANDYGLVVLTPQLYGDIAELSELVEERQNLDSGPTLIIMPKWAAYPIPVQNEVETEDGWVMLVDARAPGWLNELALTEGAELSLGQTNGWNGFGRNGDLPDETRVQALTEQPDQAFKPLVVDSEGDVLVGALEQESNGYDYEPWPVIVVFEPDLMNNYGMADRDRARAAMEIISAATLGDDLPIIFDLTLAGLGTSENLLTLAFSPPFLAATLCLILASIVIAWRAFRRFGPPAVEGPAIARGKRQLARNGAALVAQLKRFHLLKEPYEALIGKRVANHLGLRIADNDAREIAIDRKLQARGHTGPRFVDLAGDLREAERPGDIIRAARALRQFERNLTQ
ncbi:DUF4350 domain-containing protein [Aurantiacibacter sp. MUD61]|uniref:DUF4350 domain-containing protein n=1 Tax=Aurantiacibacter sp. MUD61 TaxID=3009083 RepID=UPI0022F01E13|nr:DUF4350 domain-containing protein [Aurantiacibacter sp. MUD61]